MLFRLKKIINPVEFKSKRPSKMLLTNFKNRELKTQNNFYSFGPRTKKPRPKDPYHGRSRVWTKKPRLRNSEHGPKRKYLDPLTIRPKN